MAHWFHRNPIKATNPISYDLKNEAFLPMFFEGKNVSSSAETTKVCNDLKLCRANLLEYMRDANHDVNTVEEEFNKYLSLICGFCFSPDKKGEDSKLRLLVGYRWTQSMQGNISIDLADSWFEVLNMAVNMALWLMKHAAKLAGKDEVIEAEAKTVHKCLRRAAGLFSQVQDEKARLANDLTVAVSKGSDFDSQILSAYILQCTAEAQEVTVARAIELNHNPGLISALANETSKMFQQSDDSLVSQDPVTFDKWRKYLQLKSQFYLGYAYCYLGKGFLADDKCGEAIKSVKEGHKYMEAAEKLCIEYGRSKGIGVSARPASHMFFRQLKLKLKLVLDQCERENSMIYHQRVPEEVPQLELKATYGLAKPEEFQWPKPSEMWNSKNYESFKISKAKTPDFGKAKKGEKELPPVKEEVFYQTDKDPKNNSGCTIS